MKERAKKAVLISAAILAAGCAYSVLLKSTGFGIPCLFHVITGLRCPGCGVSRMLVCLLQFDFVGAFRQNAVLFCMMPLLILLFAVHLIRYVKTGSRIAGKAENAIAAVLAGILIVWGVVRNLINM